MKILIYLIYYFEPKKRGALMPPLKPSRLIIAMLPFSSRYASMERRGALVTYSS